MQTNENRIKTVSAKGRREYSAKGQKKQGKPERVQTKRNWS